MRNGRGYYILLLVVLFVAVIAVLVLPQSRQVLIRWSAYFTAPQEVKDMLFVLGEEGNAALTRIHLGRLDILTNETVSVLEAVTHNKQVFAILQERSSGEIDIYESNLGDKDWRALTRDGEYKEGLSVSPDGTHLIYALVGPPREGRSDEYYDVRRHRIVMLNSLSGAMTEVEPGAHPFFLDQNTILFVNVEGYRVKSLVGPEESTLVGTSTTKTFLFRPSVSSNGFITYRNIFVLQDFLVARIENLFPLSLSYHKTLSAPEGSLLSDAALLGDIAYLAINTDGTTSLFKEPIVENATRTKIFTFPENITIMSMVF